MGKRRISPDFGEINRCESIKTDANLLAFEKIPIFVYELWLRRFRHFIVTDNAL